MFDYFCKQEPMTNYPVLCLLSAKGRKARYFFHICARAFVFTLPFHSTVSDRLQIFRPALFNFQIM